MTTSTPVMNAHAGAVQRLLATVRAAVGGRRSSPRAAASRNQPPAGGPSTPRRHDADRLAELLPILRCPESGQRLEAATAEELVTADGLRRWPVRHGRPCLYPGLGEPVDHGDHLSNPICPQAQDVIDAADGPVLNLSAGGTRVWSPKVVEVEAGLFRNTDVVADVHRLPFADGAFAAVVALNAFEHYRDPFLAAREIARVLRPGGRLFIHTAFLQPLHEPPWHFFNATSYGILEWFRDFHTERIDVSENFNPVHTVAWIAAEVERMVRSSLPQEEADRLLDTSLSEYARMWSDPARRDGPVWKSFFRVPVEAQRTLAAGFEYCGRRR